VSGVNCLLETGWKTSSPQTSQVYAFTRIEGLTSETLVAMPLTVINWPKCSPLTCRTDNALEVFSLLDPDGVMGLKLSVYLRVSSGGNRDASVGILSLMASCTLSFLRDR
jgi:hypothetical protein